MKEREVALDSIEMEAPKANFKPSPYQQDIFNWVEEGSGSAIVEAVAGSGKTTTIVEALRHIPSYKKADGSIVKGIDFLHSIGDTHLNKYPSDAPYWLQTKKGQAIFSEHKAEIILVPKEG